MFHYDLVRVWDFIRIHPSEGYRQGQDQNSEYRFSYSFTSKGGLFISTDLDLA